MGTTRGHSKIDTTAKELTFETINSGSLQRIADATEAMAKSSATMAKNYVQMQNDLDWYKRQYAKDQATIKHLENSRAALKAHATRLRNRLAELG